MDTTINVPVLDPESLRRIEKHTSRKLDSFARIVALTNMIQDLTSQLEEEKAALVRRMQEKDLRRVEKTYATFTLKETKRYDYDRDSRVKELRLDLEAARRKFRGFNEPDDVSYTVAVHPKGGG